MLNSMSSGSKSTPSTSILSKCVPPTQLGKIFSVTQAFSTIIGMAMGYLSTQVTIIRWPRPYLPSHLNF